MNLLELKGTQIISGRKINEVKTIKFLLEKRLNVLKARTNINENKIDFSSVKIIMPASGYTETNPTLFRIYKEGSIVIDKRDEEFKIIWTVKLDTLYVLASSIAFVSLIFSSFVIELLFSFIIGIAVFFAVIFIGIVIIMYAMNDLISSSVYKP